MTHLKGKCKRCCLSNHTTQSCNLPDSISCHHCGKDGHISRACISRLQGFGRSQNAGSSHSKNKSSKIGKKGKGGGSNKGKANSIKGKSQPPTPVTSEDDVSDSEAEEVGSTSVIKHKILLVTHKARTVSNPTPRLPVQTRPRGK